jgi:hypothetical protein
MMLIKASFFVKCFKTLNSFVLNPIFLHAPLFLFLQTGSIDANVDKARSCRIGDMTPPAFRDGDGAIKAAIWL